MLFSKAANLEINVENVLKSIVVGVLQREIASPATTCLCTFLRFQVLENYPELLFSSLHFIVSRSLEQGILGVQLLTSFFVPGLIEKVRSDLLPILIDAVRSSNADSTLRLLSIINIVRIARSKKVDGNELISDVLDSSVYPGAIFLQSNGPLCWTEVSCAVNYPNMELILAALELVIETSKPTTPVEESEWCIIKQSISNLIFLEDSEQRQRVCRSLKSLMIRLREITRISLRVLSKGNTQSRQFLEFHTSICTWMANFFAKNLDSHCCHEKQVPYFVLRHAVYSHLIDEFTGVLLGHV